ncbi:Fc receptor-like protein 5 isoform X1 [Oreochromis aureus]|uniref:Fc receptor-like protein 5 isoform X1 n=1 Tax=Oreochromis aureus TaxID=47969 RepID=UPI001954E002|nr:Fc receptor-like protein 5 isoform X1 [Oreochromis aureus]
MGLIFLCELGLFLLCTLLCTGHGQDAVLTIKPSSSIFFIGETVIFTCDMKEGLHTDWNYKLNKNDRELIDYNPNKSYRMQIKSTLHSGKYHCSGYRTSSYSTKNSNTISITVLAGKPRATLTPGSTIIPVGGSVTLTCSVGSSAGWKYEWFRRDPNTEVLIRTDDQPNRVIRVSEGGIYRCRGRRGNPVYYTDKSDDVTIEITFSNKVVVKGRPSWPQIFSGETISLTCEVQEGGETTEWEYRWRGPNQTTQWTHNNYWIFNVSESSSGDYMCKSRRRDDSYSSTEWSEAFNLSVSTGKPRATLTPGSTIIPVGGSVTLTCSVGSSADWKYEWFRRDQNTDVKIRTDDQQNRVIRVSQGGIYRCRGRRGNPDYYTDKSDDVTIEITFSNKVVVKGRPSWPQIFSGETISLTCEVQEGGETTEWEYRWRGPNQTTQWTQNNYWIFNVSESSSGDYMCKSRRRDDSYSSTEWSEAFNLSASNAVLTVEPSSTIFIGETVSFKCEVKEGEHTDWEYKIIMDGREIFNSNTNKGLRLKVASTPQSGKYSCSAHRKSSQNTKNSNTVSVTVKAGKPRATLTPGSTIIPVGGSVTLTCSVGSSADWKYEWFRRDQNTEVQIRTDDQQNRVIRVSQGGIYHCRGRRGNPDYYTDKSDDVTIEITFSNKVVVKGRPSWPQIFSGETISLTCEVQEGGETTEWEYRWRGPNQTTQWTHNNYWIFNVSESSSGDYMCKSRRRDDSYSSTEWSEAFNLSVSTGKPRATLTPGSTIIPVGGSVTLTCSVGSSAGWKYEWFRRDQNTDVKIGTDDQQNRVIRVSHGGLYCCRGRRGNPDYYTDKSDDVTIEITFSNKVVVKGRPSWPQIFSGETISLTCEVQEGGETTEWEYRWRGPNQTTQWTHNNYWIFNVSESSSGDYMCKSRRRDDSYSSTEWSEAFNLSASTVPRTGNSSFPALLIVGLICGLLLILLLLLCRFIQSKDSCFASTNQTINHTINQDEARDSQHASPHQGDACLYESVKDHDDTDNVESGDVTYSLIEFKNITQKDDSLLYAEVSHKRAKAKRNKEKSASAAAEEVTYSEVKSQPALDYSLLYAEVSHNRAKVKIL